MRDIVILPIKCFVGRITPRLYGPARRVARRRWDGIVPIWNVREINVVTLICPVVTLY